MTTLRKADSIVTEGTEGTEGAGGGRGYTTVHSLTGRRVYTNRSRHDQPHTHTHAGRHSDRLALEVYFMW